jgi:hypothetical protein
MLPFPPRKEFDMVFVLDATNSTEHILSSIFDQILDTTSQFHSLNHTISDKYGVVIYRDPVDNPNDPYDINEFRQLSADRESFSDYLVEVKGYGGRDDPEDWVGAFELALHRIKWREGSEKCLFWIADANAHGSEYSLEPRDRHNEEAPKLTRLIREAAQKQIYFIGINVKKGRDSGCEKTLVKVREIYEAEGVAELVTIGDFVCYWEIDKWEGEDWPSDGVELLKERLVGKNGDAKAFLRW